MRAQEAESRSIGAIMKAATVALLVIGVMNSGHAFGRQPAGLDRALQRLTDAHSFSGAVVIRGADGVRFAKGYGMADPFSGRRFTPDTPVDSASLAKPFTAAAVLMLTREGKLNLDSPVQGLVPEYPHPGATVRHLLVHSAGLVGDESEQAIVGETNAELLAQAAGRAPSFAPGTAFSYCNLCYSTLALVIERESGMSYLEYLRSRLALPPGVAIRPARLADWKGRAIGYRRSADGKLERADSYENELFYGSGNLSISASQLAEWGARWWTPATMPVHDIATQPATVGGKQSGLSWGNWYCASNRRRCHYLGHHEGFHHMLYWDRDRRLSVAMVSNNTLDPGLQQRLQRAIVAFAEGRDGRGELALPLADDPVISNAYGLDGGETVTVSSDGPRVSVERSGVAYRAFLVGAGIRYVPGLDVYIAGGSGGTLRWLGLYEDKTGTPLHRR